MYAQTYALCIWPSDNSKLPFDLIEALVLERTFMSMRYSFGSVNSARNSALMEGNSSAKNSRPITSVAAGMVYPKPLCHHTRPEAQ